MADFIIREHNAETNEVVDRPMTAKEIADLEATQAELQDKIANEGKAKSALLKKLGITAEEARLLLS
jgi:hypothetical protein